MGRTNTPEFGFKTVSDATLHGPVRNAVNLERNAGGSSGGGSCCCSEAGVHQLQQQAMVVDRFESLPVIMD